VETTESNRIDYPELIRLLHEPSSYPHVNSISVEVHETHISWVFLVGEYAYKVKKPITTSFLDYGTLDKRRHYCYEEMRLDARYAAGLYLDVVPITIVDGRPCVEGAGEAIEYAIKMKRFPTDALLSHRLASGTVTSAEVQQLADAVANFHLNATRLDESSSLGRTEAVLSNAIANLNELGSIDDNDARSTLHRLKSWTLAYFSLHQPEFQHRLDSGFIRECHGDLHLDNIIHWNNQLMPFDGIEFNDDFRWIDVLSDAAFLAMDLAAREHVELCRSFINEYLEATGDYNSLSLLRWYMVYRALVRAKVATIRSKQPAISNLDQQSALDDCKSHIELAHRFSQSEQRCLWITHGVSGSGKSTLSELVVQRWGAIRLRSDVQRKRLFGLSRYERPNDKLKQELYSQSAGAATYGQLYRLARAILQAGYSTIVDATFLKHSERLQFENLAASESVRFAIVNCRADVQTLRQRIAARTARNDDASDADVTVLESQLTALEPLTASEAAHVFDISQH
jgi:uncharacterized protein